MRLRVILGPMRPPFLFLTPACVSVGYGTAIWSRGRADPLQMGLVMFGALMAHIAVNTLNEYFDFRSGLDLRTHPTPFSGGSGTLPSHPWAARVPLATGLLALALMAGIGLYFARLRGPGLLALGGLGALTIVGYTPWLTRNPFLCLIAPGLGFGPLMVMGTHVALTGTWSAPALLASLVPFFLVSNLLLLNQFPDVEADQVAGRWHLPIAVGKRASARVYLAMLSAAYGTILAGVLSGLFPTGTLLGLASALLAIPLAAGVLQHWAEIEGLLPYLGLNVAVTLLTPTLLAVGFLLAA